MKRTNKDIENILNKSGVDWEKEGHLYLIDTEEMAIEKWESFRAYFCGGSDAGVIINDTCKYTNKRKLAHSKKVLLGTSKEIKNPIYQYDDNTVALRAGHALEDMVAGIYAKLTGLDVRIISKMVINEKYPYIAVNFDRIIVDTNGDMRLLEIKTSTGESEYALWGNSYAPTIPIDYCSQLSTYQLVGEDLFGDRDATIVAFMKDSQIGILAANCLPLDKEYTEDEINGLIADGMGDSIISRTYSRDKAYEEIILDGIEAFYIDFVEGDKLPEISGKNPETDKKVLNELTEKQDNEFVIEINNQEVEVACQRFTDYNAKISNLKKNLETLTSERDVYGNIIIEAMRGSEKGIVKGATKGVFNLTYRGRNSRSTDYKKLQLNHPDIYNDIITEKKSAPSLTVKFKERV